MRQPLQVGGGSLPPQTRLAPLFHIGAASRPLLLQPHVTVCVPMLLQQAHHGVFGTAGRQQQCCRRWPSRRRERRGAARAAVQPTVGGLWQRKDRPQQQLLTFWWVTAATAPTLITDSLCSPHSSTFSSLHSRSLQLFPCLSSISPLPPFRKVR